MDSELVLRQYAVKELEETKQRARHAAKLWKSGESLRKVLHYMFGVEDNPPDQAQIFGSPAESLSFCKQTAITLWPIRDPSPTTIQGIPIEELSKFIRAGIVLPLIQEPYRYHDCPRIVEIIQEFAPPSYFWRSSIVYSIISGGDENIKKVGANLLSGPAAEWFSIGLNHKVLKNAPEFRDTWEPKHQCDIPNPITEWGVEYIRESFAFKYVNSCAFLGQDFVNTLLENIKTERALRFLTTFHILTDHPISHALLTNAAVNFTSPDWSAFVQKNADYYCNENLAPELTTLPLQIMAKPIYRDYMEMREAGVEPLPVGAFVKLNSFDKTELSAFRTRLESSARTYNNWIEKLEKKKKTIQRTVRFSAFCAGVANYFYGIIGDREALSSLFFGILLDQIATDYVVEKIQNARMEHLITQIFQRNLDENTSKVLD